MLSLIPLNINLQVHLYSSTVAARGRPKKMAITEDIEDNSRKEEKSSSKKKGIVDSDEDAFDTKPGESKNLIYNNSIYFFHID
jgi:hypothetical protein